MEKKRVGKIVALTLIAVLAVALMCVGLAGCGSSNVLTIKENGTYSTFGHDRVSVEVPTESSAYNVTINTVESTPTNKTRVEVIEDIRPTVVDVYGRAANGTSAGSGVIVGNADNEYFIVTNQHVTSGCSTFSVDVLFIDEETDEETYRSYEADFIGGSPKRDIAVLRIEKAGDEELKTANVADSGRVKVGEDVIAIGNPLGILGGTVTMGIISATARDVSVEDIGTMTLMQTDAAINSGNSGGGLFDTNGNLVGIVNSGYSSYEGLNFAIPSNDAVYAAESLIGTYKEGDGTVQNYGYVTGDADLGLTYAAADVYLSSTSNSYKSVVYATSVDSSGPFAGTGIVAYSDYNKYGYFHAVVSISYGSKQVSIGSTTDLDAAINDMTAGDQITVTLQKIKFRNSGFRQTAYLDSEKTEISVTAEQYIYNP